ncbi:DUF2760 domain-containing protein [Schlesneria paludicola]|uniref:DUF2760 domain-containing protein n=1 Tax=Schlesneria paludicola TaxID=360056 RepID=UPI00029A32E2|nr:DUF2760 domain-containing protein [Schlesneria paludicola]
MAGRVSTAFRAFFAALANREAAERIDHALKDQPTTESPVAPALPSRAEPVKTAPERPKQNEAVTLLATLQREARLVDFLKEEISGYSDEQIGAAVREIHRESASVLNRMFAIQPVLEQDEGASVEVPEGFDPARYRLTGKISGQAPFRGTLRHHGWIVTRSEFPEFIGNESAAKTICPAEVEVQP